jgi:hypothetical protein
VSKDQVHFSWARTHSSTHCNVIICLIYGHCVFDVLIQEGKESERGREKEKKRKRENDKEREKARK